MMAATYIPIQSVTLASSAASVSFSSIPQTFTDIVVRFSARTDYAGPNELITCTINGVGGTSYSHTTLIGNGSTVISNRNSSAAYTRIGWSVGSTATANTFGSTEIYLPNYTSIQSKPANSFSVAENNSSTTAGTYINVNANLLSVASAISSIALVPINASNFVAGSTFHLYGIKNS